MTQTPLKWQSKTVLLAVLPYVCAALVVQVHFWILQDWAVAVWALGLSALLGVVVLALHAATQGGAATGFAISASVMFSTATVPYEPWRTGMMPILAVALLTHLATRLGRARKEELGIAEAKTGRKAAQVAANLGLAALAMSPVVQVLLADADWFPKSWLGTGVIFAMGLAALAEAAADTVSSEIGQVLGGTPRMITTLRAVEPGTDGAISVMGTLAGAGAAIVIAAVGTWALHGDRLLFAASVAGGVFGLFFDSVLGATLELRGKLNNDAVNFLSTVSAAGFAVGVLMGIAVVRGVWGR
ncbi:MAG: DUF92 domain-containing protein [Acidobacteriota bacterium]|nr:DUF92 domain-containing protein [Acidobacteriota bacterium]